MCSVGGISFCLESGLYLLCFISHSSAIAVEEHESGKRGRLLSFSGNKPKTLACLPLSSCHIIACSLNHLKKQSMGKGEAILKLLLNIFINIVGFFYGIFSKIPKVLSH